MKKLLSELILVLSCLLLVSNSMAKDEEDKLDVRVDALEEQVLVLQEQVAALESLLANVTRGVDPNTGYETIQFSGMNLQIVNGSGATESTNGTGNLIIGYNELREEGNVREGSHVLVIGPANNYTSGSHSGMVVGKRNNISNHYASVLGGEYNSATGWGAVVSGGYNRQALEQYDWVAGDFYQDQ